MQPVTILPDYVSYFRQLHYGFTLLRDSWAPFFLRRKMTSSFFKFAKLNSEACMWDISIQHREATYIYTYISYCYYDIKPAILLSCADLFGCGTRAWQPDPPPHWQSWAIKGGFAINPPSAEPLGGTTPSSSTLRPPPATTTTALSKYRWERRAGGDRVSRHPSSTGLRFSLMATNLSSSPSSSSSSSLG